MTEKLSYILIGDSRGTELMNKTDQLQLSGLYLWSTAFSRFGKSGTIEPFWRKEDLEDFDIVHINYTPSNIQLPTVIRDELGSSSSTKVVMNIDLDVSQMSPSWAYYTNAMVKELKMADVIFHVEPKGAEILSHLLDREVRVCPHPVDVSCLYDSIKAEREPMIATIFHRYTGCTLIQYIAQRNIPLRRVLMGYTPIGKVGAVANAGMYDQILPYMSFQEHVEEVSKAAVGCDMYSGYSYGRAAIEFAALCIPSVVSDTIAASHLFPETTVHPFDTKGAEERFRRLISDEDFANSVIKTAHDGCSYYSLQNSYARFIEIMEDKK
jgi:hypothetical protein